jgi:ribulose-phosphate 3-epimerase
MLKCSTSLWSADLASLAREIQRVEPYSERFHVDVADGHYVPNLLFFPDLVRACRQHTAKPMEVHLMTTDPLAWVEPFAEAGADGFILCFDSLHDPADAIAEVKRRGKMVGVSLSIPDPVGLLEPFWKLIDQVTILGTPMGIKGANMDPAIPDKIRSVSAAIRDHGAQVDIRLTEASGGRPSP